MTRQFEAVKLEFGTNKVTHLPDFRFWVLGLQGYSNEDAKVVNGRMVISKYVILTGNSFNSP